MSIRVMAKIWQFSPVKRPTDLLLLIALADNANDEGWAWPGKPYLAEKIRVEKRSVDRIAIRLMEMGEIDIYNRTAETSEEDYTNVYHLFKYGDPNAKPPIDLRGKLQKKTQTPQSGGDDRRVRGGMTDESGGDDSPVRGGMTPRSSKPSLEPSLNPSFETTTKTAAVVVPDRPEIYSVYEQNIGLLTPIIANNLKDLVSDYTYPWVVDAIEIAVKSNARSLRYVEGILSKWRANGRDKKKDIPPAAAQPTAQDAALATAIAAEYQRLGDTPPDDFQPGQALRVFNWNGYAREKQAEANVKGVK